MISVAARDGIYQLQWTGKKWIDRAGARWYEAPKGWSFDFKSPVHGEARIVESRREGDSYVQTAPQYVRDRGVVYDSGSLRTGRRDR